MNLRCLLTQGFPISVIVALFRFYFHTHCVKPLWLRNIGQSVCIYGTLSNYTMVNRKCVFQVFHYQEVAYPPMAGRFKERVVWSGDVSNRDASITLQGVPPTFNGTYSCQVRNPPDVHGINGEIVLKVVDKGQRSSCYDDTQCHLILRC